MLRRFALVRQEDQSACGAAALASVALHYRRPVALQEMRELSGTDRSGTSLRGLREAAEKLGFSTRALKGPYDSLPQLPLPAIVHLKTEEGLGHFVVLYQARKDRVVIADPARGIQKLARAAFCKLWTGCLLLLVPEKPSACGTRGVSTAAWRRLLGLLHGRRSQWNNVACSLSTARFVPEIPERCHQC
jgi:ATP-binding cassette subfamily B protein